MTDERDEELDPSDWLASQFDEQPAPAPPAPVRPDSAAPLQSAAPPPTGLPPAFPSPPYVPPAFPTAAAPPASPAFPPAAPPSSASGSPFSWGLTPGADPAQPVPPYQQPAPAYEQPPQPAVPPPYTPPPLVPPATAFPPTQPPYTPPPVLPLPPITETTVYATLEPTQAIGINPDPFSFTPSGRGAPLDPALDGATEVLGAQAVGLPSPEDEGVGASALDSLFGESSFVDYGDQLIAPLPPRGSTALATIPRAPQAPRAPIPRTQKILMWVAGGLVAALALVALYLVGTKLAQAQPAPAVAASPSPSPSPSAGLALGPVKPGDYNWSALLGGECLDPFDSAWQDSYTVVDCTKPHPAQMVYRGIFPDPDGAVYPGVDELQKRIATACAAPTVINYAVAGTAQDIQVAASYAADENDWNNGNRTFFCFVNRKAGEPFTESIAVPQTAPATPAPTAGAAQ